MSSDNLDRRITLQRFTYSSDEGSGEQVKTWGTLGPAAIWAARRRASANETLAASGLSAAISDVFEIRWDSAWSDLSALDRLVFEGRVHEIVSVDEIGRRVRLRIGTVARADGAP